MKVSLIAFFAAVLFLGCSKSEETHLNVKLANFSHSECGGFKSESLFADELQEQLIVAHEQKQVYSISHSNVEFNCCLPKGLGIELTLQNDTIYINEKEIEILIEKILKENKKAIADYLAGEESALNFLIGQIMKESKGRADIKIIRKIITKKIN